MPLDAGTRLGPYEITAQIGAGGMGEVCRARDTKLNRDVALKVLPAALAADQDRMLRFQREAQLLAALNHPSIAAIYGLEDDGARQAIVMELVEGHTLEGPMPVAEALQVAKQIADAIEYAHERGIIHRDLKPANIKVTPEGAVKVLDFGLAKAMDAAGDSGMHLQGTMSPTLSLGATQAGMILGTAGYMAPEQAKGKAADRRSDVWAFGVVLYEILTGEHLFGGDTVPETLASVMKDQLSFGKLPDETPAAIRTLVTRCLERDPRRRLQSIGEARIVIEDVIAGVAPPGGTTDHASMGDSRAASRGPWAVAAVALLVAAASLGWAWSRPAPLAPAVTRFTVPPPDGATLTSQSPNASQLAMSPDGRYVAFVADEAGRERTIWVRALDSLVPQRLDRTEGSDMPFWSPDSQHIGYFANGKLMRISVAGGAPVTICDAADPEGGTWFQPEGGDGVIVFAPDATGPLRRVPAQGGVPSPLTTLAEGETAHSFPQFLPDGQRFLYLAEGGKPGIYVQSLGSDERTRIVDTSGRGAFSPPGVLLYLRDSTLMAHRWNLDTLELQGEPVPIAEDVRVGGANGRNAFSVSASGVLAYRRGAGGGRVQVTWYSRDGKPAAVVLEGGEYGPIELSPDDTRMVAEQGTGDDRDLWLKDLASGVFSRLTTADGREADPAWSSDSRRVAYVGTLNGKNMLFETLIGSGTHAVIPGGDSTFINDWTPDGKYLVLNAARTVSLLAAPGSTAVSTEGGKPQTILETRFNVDQLRVSPDGRWVAYMSTESGQPEVYVASFPAFTDRRQISVDSGGAVQPLWRADGKELFFLSRLDDTLVAVDVKAGETLETGPLRKLFRASINNTQQSHMYAVTRNGQRFLIREPVGADGDAIEQLHIVTNWTSLVR